MLGLHSLRIIDALIQTTSLVVMTCIQLQKKEATCDSGSLFFYYAD